jgi:hypothetical protein
MTHRCRSWTANCKLQHCAATRQYSPDTWVSWAMACVLIIWRVPPKNTLPMHRSVVSCWVGLTISRVRLGSGTQPTDHLLAKSCYQVGFMFHTQDAWCGTKHNSDNWVPMKCAWMDDLGFDHLPDVLLHGCCVTGVKLFRCRISVTMSKWGWTNDQGTDYVKPWTSASQSDAQPLSHLFSYIIKS